MDWIYFFGNASLVMRLISWLQTKPELQDSHITVVHRLEGWVVKVRPITVLSTHQIGDAQALMAELGTAFAPPRRLQDVFYQLEAGHSPTDVMRQCQVVVVSHGAPNQRDIAAFRERFIHGLGYCPAHLA